MIRGKNILLLMDSHLEGNFSTEEATIVMELASQCLQYEPRERPNTKKLVATLAPLQTKSDVSVHLNAEGKLIYMHFFYSKHHLILSCRMQVPSYVMLGISKHEEAPPTPQHPLSPMGEACQRMDLTAIHQILVMTHYKDDEGTNEVTDFGKVWIDDHCQNYKLKHFLCNCPVIFPGVDPANERHAGREEAWGFCIS